jgi:hypothetical protein
MSMDEALMRLRLLYTPEAIEKVFPGNRPRLPTQDKSIPICTQPVHKAKPTMPDNPDPKLRPLDQYTIASAVAEEDVDAMPGFDEPSPYDEEADQIDAELFDAQQSSRPKPEDLPQTRTSFRGQARQARRTPHALPDVAGPQKTVGSGQHDHDRPKS